MSSSDTPTSTSQASDSSSISASSSSMSSSDSSSSCANSGKRGETSPVDSPPLKKPKIEDNSSNVEFIERFLECSVCLDFPSSPIHNCDNAHFLCGQCAPWFSACPTCQLPKLLPSPVGEKLAKEANKKIECANFVAGCNYGVLSTKFAEHLPLCYFREITCCKQTCGAKVQFHQYTNHLEDVHFKEINDGRQLTKNYLYDKKIHAKGVWERTHSILKFDCHHFLACAQISSKSQVFFAWLCILGDKATADNYNCKIELKNPDLSRSDCTWRLPVLAYHEIPENESEAKLFENSAVLSIPLQTVGKFGKIEKDKHFFNVTYAIKEV